MRRLLLMSLALLVACGASTAPKYAPVNGPWRGASIDGVTLILSLDEHGGFVRGTATLGDANVPNSLTVDGIFAPPNLALTITKSGSSSPLNLTGAISVDRLTATLNGSGFVNLAINLNRDH